LTIDEHGRQEPTARGVQVPDLAEAKPPVPTGDVGQASAVLDTTTTGTRSTEDASQPNATDQGAGGRFEGPLQLLTVVGTNITVVAALLVFFGWKRAEAHSRILGVNESIWGMSPQDYILRSVDALFPLLAVVVTIGLGWLWIHATVSRKLSEVRWLRLLEAIGGVLGFAWLLIPAVCALLASRFPDVGYVLFPLSLAGGVLLTWYGIWLRAQAKVRRTGGSSSKLPDWHGALTKTLIALFVTLSLFWAVSNYATLVGERLGRGLSADLPQLAQVVVYSPERLGIAAPGVREAALSGSAAAYRFRYTGLRLLEHTGGKYFLVSDGWTPRFGVVVVLAETDPVRLEFVHGRRPAGSPALPSR
jgi:hypothetical protein